MSRTRTRAQTSYFSNPIIRNSKSSTLSESKINLENQKTDASSSIKKEPVNRDDFSLTPKSSTIRNELISKDNIANLREDNTVNSDTSYQDVSKILNSTEFILTNKRISSRRKTICDKHSPSVAINRCQKLSIDTSIAIFETVSTSEPVGKDTPVRRKAICTETLEKVLFPPESSFVLRKPTRMTENSTVESPSLTPNPTETGLKIKPISVRRKNISSALPSVPVRRCKRLLTNTSPAIVDKKQVNHGDSENVTLTPASSDYNKITRTVSTSKSVGKDRPVKRRAICTETLKRPLFTPESSIASLNPNPSTGLNNKRITSRRTTISLTSVPLRRSERLLNNTSPAIVKKEQRSQDDCKILTPKTSTFQNELTSYVSSSKRFRIDDSSSISRSSINKPTFRKELFPIELTFALNKPILTTEDSKTDAPYQNSSVTAKPSESVLSNKRIPTRRNTISSMRISSVPICRSKISLNKTSTPIVIKSIEKSTNRNPAVIHAIDVIETHNVNYKLISATKISNRSKSTCIASHSEKQVGTKISVLKSDVNGIEAKGKIEIIIPHALELLLITDVNVVKRKKKLYKIPATQNVAKVVEDYVALKQPENVREVCNGLTFNQIFKNIIEYCDKLLGQFLYSSTEQEQYLDLQYNFRERNMSTLYPPIYLLRLMVQLNSLIQLSNRDKDSRQFSACHMTEFAKYLAENHSVFIDTHSFC